ncbi:hypothetical protein H6P81_016153 [Aristolochia fimbriata]|uniref:Uncharacterized protein n=1 Tax=Aristolochia fimbriata TaxID=158543 RepID=A0AAV7EC44_ARIFI|nr:hypothetical protein H6P81_016153 [Aristolochia fimbriata]
MLKKKEEASQSDLALNEKAIVVDTFGHRSGYIKGQGLGQPPVSKGPHQGRPSSIRIEEVVEELKEHQSQDMQSMKEQHAQEKQSMKESMLKLINANILLEKRPYTPAQLSMAREIDPYLGINASPQNNWQNEKVGGSLSPSDFVTQE